MERENNMKEMQDYLREFVETAPLRELELMYYFAKALR